jgi:hypothetical protein
MTSRPDFAEIANEAAVQHANKTWFIVSQVKSHRVVYFTDDPGYTPPTEGDWFYVSPYQGELPQAMSLRNCWGWGSKRFLLYPPHNAGFLYLKQANPALAGSPFDPDAPDYAAFPLARQARQIECVVQAGELLFLPAGWFHHVRAETFSLSANRWTRERPLALNDH